MAIKFTASQSIGIPFGTDETRSVELSNEALDKASGYEGDTIVYAIDLKDSMNFALPATFVVKN